MRGCLLVQLFESKCDARQRQRRRHHSSRHAEVSIQPTNKQTDCAVVSSKLSFIHPTTNEISRIQTTHKKKPSTFINNLN